MRFLDGNTITRFIYPHIRHILHHAVFFVIWGEVFAENTNAIVLPKRPAHHATERVERRAIAFWDEFGNHHHGWCVRVTRPHCIDEFATVLYRAAVSALNLHSRAFFRRRDVCGEHIRQPRRGAENLLARHLEQRLRVCFRLLWLQFDAKFLQLIRHAVNSFTDNLAENFVQRFEDELHEGALAAARRWLLLEHPRIAVIIHIAPHPLCELLMID